MNPLRERLKEWTDADIAQYEYGVLLGIFPDDDPECPYHFFREYKWVFWTDNPLGNMLFKSLKRLAQAGVLEWDPEEISFRAAPMFDVEAAAAQVDVEPVKETL